MGASAYGVETRDRYIQEAKSAAFQDAVFLIAFYNKDVKRWGPPPKLPDIEPEEVFVSFDQAEHKVCQGRASSLMASSGSVGASFFSYPHSRAYEDELVFFKEKNPGFSERCYFLAASAGIRDMR